MKKNEITMRMIEQMMMSWIHTYMDHRPRPHCAGQPWHKEVSLKTKFSEFGHDGLSLPGKMYILANAAEEIGLPVCQFNLINPEDGECFLDFCDQIWRALAKIGVIEPDKTNKPALAKP